MKKIILLLSLTLCSCISSNNSRSYFNYPNNNNIVPTQFKIHVRKVNISLSEDKLLVSDMAKLKYPDVNQLEQIVKEIIIDQLKSDGIYSNSKNDPETLECEFNIKYARVFMVFTNDRYAGSRLDGYKIVIFKNNEIIASRENNTRYAANQGLFGNIQKIAKNLSLSGNPNDEKIEIEIFAREIARELKMLGK